MIKVFEKFNNENIEEPEIYDYVIMKSSYGEDINNFLCNNVGQITFIGADLQNDNVYVVYPSSEIPKRLEHYFRKHDKNVSLRIFEKHEILYYSKNREDLEIIIQANKYNL